MFWKVSLPPVEWSWVLKLESSVAAASVPEIVRRRWGRKLCGGKLFPKNDSDNIELSAELNFGWEKPNKRKRILESLSGAFRSSPVMILIPGRLSWWTWGFFEVKVTDNKLYGFDKLIGLCNPHPWQDTDCLPPSPHPLPETARFLMFPSQVSLIWFWTSQRWMHTTYILCVWLLFLIFFILIILLNILALGRKCGPIRIPYHFPSIEEHLERDAAL